MRLKLHRRQHDEWPSSAAPAGSVGCALAAYVYLLRCSDGSLYCGWSTDPERRLSEHQAGTASRYTRARLPVELAWSAECEDRAHALREEARIKRLPTAAKRALAG